MPLHEARSLRLVKAYRRVRLVRVYIQNAVPGIWTVEVRGANVPALLRALVACGWFGIQTWIGGSAIYQIAEIHQPAWADLPKLHAEIEALHRAVSALVREPPSPDVATPDPAPLLARAREILGQG